MVNSTSSYLLKSMFETVLQESVFQGGYDTIHSIQDGQLHPDLRLYLLKLVDRIAQLCKGDLSVSQKFLNDLMRTMIPALIVTKDQIEMEAAEDQHVKQESPDLTDSLLKNPN